MREETDQLVRLEQRIADLRRCIEQAREQDGRPWVGDERERVLALLSATLRDLESRKAALEGANR